MWGRRAALTFFIAVAWPAMAHAESKDAAAAEVLFDEGRRLMKEEHYPEACAKFEASQRLDPGVGTLLNLGDCLEHAGRMATAWARFREAASLAVASSQKEREQAARDRAQALESRLVRLVVKASPEASMNSDLSITRDGVVLEREAWGAAVPVDPGKHVVRATAQGKASWSVEVDVKAEPPGGTETVTVPPLVAAEAPPSPGGAQRTIGIIVGGLGVVAVGVGTGFALSAKSSYDTARGHCTSNGCSDASRAKANSAGNTADVATGLFIGGAVALVAGVVLFLTAPRKAQVGFVDGLGRATFAF
jgi:hypothetical protein